MSISPTHAQTASTPLTYSEDTLRTLIPQLDAQANKYTRGKLTLVAGSARYPGAACLAAGAAQRAGAGYVEVLCAPEAVSIVRGYRPSLVVRSWEDAQAALSVESTPDKPAALVVGPGFDGFYPLQRKLALKALRAAKAPALVDGGALSALASAEGREVMRAREGAGLITVLTPHGGEAARLRKAARIEELPACEEAVRLAQAYAGIVVLKGPDTFISDGARLAVVTCGTPALAKAGTGDVLAGVAGALMAQGLEAFDACVLAAELHARAALACSSGMPALCVIPEDVIEAIPAAVGALLRGAK